MQKKEWLKANGFPDIKLGKGRLSNEQRAALEAAVARGVKIDGYTVTKDSTSTPKVERTAAPTTIADIGDPTFPERNWQAFVGTNEVGMRTVCDNCHNSMTYCRDGSPAIMYNNQRAVVTLKPRPNPETYREKWW